MAATAAVGEHVDRGGDVAEIVLTADHFEAALETVGPGRPEQDDVDGQGASTRPSGDRAV